MPHQAAAVERAKVKTHLALFMDAGLGKTATQIHILRDEYNKRRKILRTLIFAPMTVCPNWLEEFKKFSKIPIDQIHVLTGSGKTRVAALERAMECEKAGIVVTNYEAVQIDAFYELLLKWAPEISVLDESHRVKDSQSKRAKKIYPLVSMCQRRFLLTGTPIPNSLMDIFGQYKALDTDIFGGGFWSFRTRYFYNRNAGKQFGYPDWVPFPTAAEHIGKVLAETSVQARRDECLSLPPLQTIKVPFEMSVGQAKSYREMKKDFLTELGDSVCTAEFAMTKTIRMQQILSGFIQPDDKENPEWFGVQPRLDALMDILDGIGKEKCIIWTTFQPTYARIGAELKKAGYKYAFITGEQTHAQKQEAITDFKGGDTQIIIANPAAASEGINLQEARYAVYFNRGFNLLHFLQSLARNYRSGTERLHKSVCHYILHAKDTLDDAIGLALDQKMSAAEAVMEWSKGAK